MRLPLYVTWSFALVTFNNLSLLYTFGVLLHVMGNFSSIVHVLYASRTLIRISFFKLGDYFPMMFVKNLFCAYDLAFFSFIYSHHRFCPFMTSQISRRQCLNISELTFSLTELCIYSTLFSRPKIGSSRAFHLFVGLIS